jgi:hypothetical protein
MQKSSPIVLLWVLGVLFVLVGVAFIAAPATFTEMAADVAPDRPSALTDIRAVSGGVALALGVFFALCAVRPDWVGPGLLLGALVGACLAVSRLIGFVADGGVTATQVSLAVTEAIVVALCLLALRGWRSVER